MLQIFELKAHSGKKKSRPIVRRHRAMQQYKCLDPPAIDGYMLALVMKSISQFVLNRGAALSAVALFFCICEHTTVAAEKTASKPASSIRKSDFASQVQDTERLKELRKRIAEYEQALSRGIEPPELEAQEPQWAPPPEQESNALKELSPSAAAIERLKKSPMDKSSIHYLKQSLTGSTNTQDKALLGTVYCLGCLATDQWQEGMRISIRMRKAFPDDPNVKLLSLATFISPCRKCSGSGKLSQKCTLCKGSKKCAFIGCANGILSNPDLRIDGRPPLCPACTGTGKCKTCGGTGSIKTSCKDCVASGKMLSVDSIEKGYIQLLRSVKL